MQKIKREVEALIGCDITEELFMMAYLHAKSKQRTIYEQEHREVVMKKWYLFQLITEYVNSFLIQQLTMDLVRTMYDMEKEHPFTEQGTPKANHIVPVSVS